jgi:hypothetical protein
MMMRLVLVLVTLVIAFCRPAVAQVAPAPFPLGATSPLGIGPAPPVTSPGIPPGATELTSPGLSPTIVAPVISNCSGEASGASSSGSSALFDGGASGTTSVNCGPSPPSFAQPTASASSPTGMVVTPFRSMQIPLGATELGGGGLSPLPPTMTTPTQTTEAFSASTSSAVPTTLGTSVPVPAAQAITQSETTLSCAGPIGASGGC